MPINVKKIFGENVRNYRRKQNLTQEKLAELIDVSPKHLGVIERGDAFVSAELLEKLSETLHIQVSTLFYTEEENTGSESFLKKFDRIVETELSEVARRIKSSIRE